PDAFTFAVLEQGSNAGWLTSNDPTTANALFKLELRPGSTPTIYAPGPGDPANAWNVTVAPEPDALAGSLAALAALLRLRRRAPRGEDPAAPRTSRKRRPARADGACACRARARAAHAREPPGDARRTHAGRPRGHARLSGNVHERDRAGDRGTDPGLHAER